MRQRVHVYAGFFVFAVTVHHKGYSENREIISPTQELAHD